MRGGHDWAHQSVNALTIVVQNYIYNLIRKNIISMVFIFDFS